MIENKDKTVGYSNSPAKNSLIEKYFLTLLPLNQMLTIRFMRLNLKLIQFPKN